MHCLYCKQFKETFRVKFIFIIFMKEKVGPRMFCLKTIQINYQKILLSGITLKFVVNNLDGLGNLRFLLLYSTTPNINDEGL